jgi:hypothetical protein
MPTYYIMVNSENIIKLYKKYKSVGGFGIYSLDALIGKDIQPNNIDALVQQERNLIELYNATYDAPITCDILEKQFLGRKRIDATVRVTTKMSKYRLPHEYTHARGYDPYDIFMRSNTIKGYMNREYWKERSVMKNELA